MVFASGKREQAVLRPFTLAKCRRFLTLSGHFQIMHLNTLLADVAAPAAAAATGTSGTSAQPAPTGLQALFSSPLPMLILFGIAFYFILIRPQSQQRKKQAALLNALKTGDKVVTSAGIVGVVITVKDNTVSLRSADAKMEVTKVSVIQIMEGSAATEA
jgi:preprotein translocase subunit YajC